MDLVQRVTGVPNTQVDMSNDAGEVRIPVTGTPTQVGMVNIGTTLLGQTVSVNSEVKPSGKYRSCRYGIFISRFQPAGVRR